VPYADALVLHDIVAAYATQSHVAETLGADVGGWKVGIRPDGTPMAAPIYADAMKTSGATWLVPQAGRELVVEVELALRLEDDLPSGRVLTRATKLLARSVKCWSASS
jgi:2-keto-4-pentenoate hydratase